MSCANSPRQELLAMVAHEHSPRQELIWCGPTDSPRQELLALSWATESPRQELLRMLAPEFIAAYVAPTADGLLTIPNGFRVPVESPRQELLRYEPANSPRQELIEILP